MPTYKIVVHELVAVAYPVKAKSREEALEIFKSTEDQMDTSSEDILAAHLESIIDPDGVEVPIIEEEEPVS